MDRTVPADGGPRDDVVLDTGHLARQTFGDAALERELLGLFAGQATSLAARIGGGAEAERRVAAHTLKGSARAVGAWALAAAAAALEAGEDGLGRLEAELARAQAAVRDHLAQHGG
jgi:HPt (histidine-containing phosphotransfer) domain-containing protein